MTNVIKLVFETDKDKNFSLSIPKATTSLSESALKTVMNKIIASEALATDCNLTKRKSAKLYKVQKTTMEFE